MSIYQITPGMRTVLETIEAGGSIAYSPELVWLWCNGFVALGEKTGFYLTGRGRAAMRPVGGTEPAQPLPLQEGLLP